MNEIEIILEKENGEKEIDLENEGTLILPQLENLEITPTKEQQVFKHENSDGYDNVTVKPIPDEYIIPEGMLPITENATYDVTNYARVSASVHPAIPDEYIVPTGTLEITENGSYDVKQYAEVQTNIEGVAKKYAPRHISFYNYGGTELDTELENLDTSNMNTFKMMFYSCVYITNLDLEQCNWNTSNVTSMEQMFYGMQNVNSIKFSNFDTSKVTSMKGSFQYCYKLSGDIDLSSLNLSNVTDVANCFDNASSRGKATRIICPNLYKITTLQSFANSNTLTTYIDLSNAGRDGTGITSVVNMCNNSTGLLEIDLTNANFSPCKSFASMFYSAYRLEKINGMSTWKNTTATTLNSMFYDCRALTSIDLSGFTTTSVTNMGKMFQRCYALMHLDIRNFNFSKVTTYTNMFTDVPANCEIIVADDTARNWVLTQRSDFTNVKTVAEL